MRPWRAGLSEGAQCLTVHPAAAQVTVTSAVELVAAIEEALALRASAATGIHSASSRSHAVCRVRLRPTGGVLTLVDLAGSVGPLLHPAPPRHHRLLFDHCNRHTFLHQSHK